MANGSSNDSSTSRGVKELSHSKGGLFQSNSIRRLHLYIQCPSNVFTLYLHLPSQTVKRFLKLIQYSFHFREPDSVLGSPRLAASAGSGDLGAPNVKGRWTSADRFLQSPLHTSGRFSMYHTCLRHYLMATPSAVLNNAPDPHLRNPGVQTWKPRFDARRITFWASKDQKVTGSES